MSEAPKAKATEWPAAAPLLLWAAAFACFGLDNNDTWWHLASGRLILAGGFPTTDPFSHLLDRVPWVDEYWLFQIALLGLWNLGGAAALSLFRCLWMTGLVAGIGFALRRRGVPWAVFAASAVPCLIVMSDRMTVRPELVTWACLAAFLLLLPRGTERPTRRALIALPVIQILWTNCHPAFLVGPVVIAMTAFAQGLSALWRGERATLLPLLRAHALLFALVLAATLINPYGHRLHLLPFTLTDTEVFLRHIIEWQSPAHARNAVLRHVVPIFAALAAPALLLTLRRREAIHWVWFAAFGYLGLQAVRHSALFALVSMIVLAEAWAAALSGRRFPRWGHALVGALLALLLLLTLTGWVWHWWGSYRRFGLEPFPWRFPEASAQFVAAHSPQGEVFNDYNIGGHLLWHLAPERQVAIDGRLIVYGGDLLDTTLGIVNGEVPWEPFFAEHGIHWALLSNEAEHLIRSLWQAPEWHLVFVGPRGVVFVDDSPTHAPLIAEFAMAAEDLDPLAGITPVPRGPRWMAPPTPYLAVRRAHLLGLLDRPDLAAEVFEAQAALLPGDRQLAPRRGQYLLLGARHLMQAQQWREAEVMLRRLIEIEPENVSAWNNLGVLYARTGHGAEAEEAWNRALALDPANTAIHTNLQRLRARATSPESQSD